MIAANPIKRKIISQERRFQILHRDGFTCQYCGAKPGSENLEVDHLIPVSRGGSDNPMNLVASCKTCNRNRSDQPLFPGRMILGRDDEGWDIIANWGVWAIKACSRGVVVAGAVYGRNDIRTTAGEYWFEASRSHEPDWEDHISRKEWDEPHTYADFISALEWAREMTAPRK